MHRLRMGVRENRLSEPSRVREEDYLRFVEAGSAWVAMVDGRIAGFAALDVTGASVWALFVAPGTEGAGVGRALHEALIADARRRGLDELRLGTAPGTRAELFYARAGWEQAGWNEEGETLFRMDLGR